MKILSYYEFLNEEFRKIKFDGSLSGKTKVLHNILNEPESPKSYSSNILLRDQLRKKEIDNTIADSESFNKLSKKEKARIRSYKNSDKIKRALFNLKFLKDRENELGELRCEYCNKGPLVVYSFEISKKSNANVKFDRNDGATCDHKNPTSLGGDKFNYDNLAVCCYNCNQKKSNMSWENWEKILPTISKH